MLCKGIAVKDENATLHFSGLTTLPDLPPSPLTQKKLLALVSKRKPTSLVVLAIGKDGPFFASAGANCAQVLRLMEHFKKKLRQCQSGK